jgi:translation initiation factor IF-3
LAESKNFRINDQIKVREVRLINENGEQMGVFPLADALNMAIDRGLDLVEIAPQSVPPVCKIINYGKFKFEQEKKQKDNRKNQKVIKVKEIRMQPKIDDHDLDFKSKHVRGFLAEGNRVKVTVRFRGRELAHTEIGEDVLKSVLARVEGLYTLERPPTMEGRFMSMTLIPKAPGAKKQEAPKPAQGEDIQ